MTPRERIACRRAWHAWLAVQGWSIDELAVRLAIPRTRAANLYARRVPHLWEVCRLGPLATSLLAFLRSARIDDAQRSGR